MIRAEHETLEAELRTQFDVVETRLTLAGREYRLLRPRNADDLLDEAAFNHDGRIPYWAEIWISGRILAEQLASEQGAGRRLLELGCGIGTASYAALAAGFDVVATDYYADALRFVVLNAARNRLPTPQTRMVDWRKLPADLGRYDRVVAADVLYEKPNAELVAQSLAATLADKGLALVTDPERAGSAAFPAACQQRGLLLTRHSIETIGDTGRPQTIQLYRIQWP